METLTELLKQTAGSGILPIVFTFLMMGVFIFLSSKLNPWQHAWEKYEGSIITAIKLAEKQIPDDTPNKSIRRLNAALTIVLNAYATANKGKKPSAKTIESIKQGIQIKHNDLEKTGSLKSAKES